MTSLASGTLPSVRTLCELCGLRIVFFNTLAALAGFLLAAGEADGRMVVLALGVAALACGARSLNQYQERRTDALMPRTGDRPLCSGRLRPAAALAFSICCILLGLSALLLTGSPAPPLLGAFAVAWYNGLYTGLKRLSSFAVVPGSLVGAVPPALGWAAAGGALTDARLWYLCFFFFMWQVPHFWIFILRYGDEYTRAGLPSLTATLGSGRASRVVFAWVGAAAVSSLLMIQGGLLHHAWLLAMLLAGSCWIILSGGRLLREHLPGLYADIFRRINLYVVLVLALLVLDRVVRP
jgi:protoheme IX farnesyltransferase